MPSSAVIDAVNAAKLVLVQSQQHPQMLAWIGALPLVFAWRCCRTQLCAEYWWSNNAGRPLRR
jgi:hypothetical protein